MHAVPTNALRLEARTLSRNQRQWMHHTWRDLLFLHWRCDPAVIQPTLPPGLTVDTFAGSAWVGIVPFQMRNIRPVCCPALPGTANFLELNVRTYVCDALGRPGVWFYSLDANCWPAVRGARWSYHLPYHWARMSFCRDDASGTINFQSARCASRQVPPAEFDFRPRGIPTASHDPASLPFFLIERYYLFAHTRGRLYCGQVQHHPYQVTGVELRRWDTSMLALNSLPVPECGPEHIAYSQGVDVRVYGLQPV